ncbi:MAG TPA: hypothetical protein VEB18_02900 [Candidatus Paceibacterota bacterium]|nr:hypothetical protein [Candidatus Paceibacterota bacterium]
MKKFIPFAAASAWALPLLALAQVNSIFSAAEVITRIINGVVIPLVFAVAFIVFIVGVVRYFIANEGDDRKNARSLMIYGILGFFVMVAVWGLVNILLGTFNLNQNTPNLPSAPGPR